mgnify:CR=1 FL=1
MIKHSESTKVGAVIGYTIEKTDWVQSAMSKKDFISNDTPVFDAGNVLTSNWRI